MLETLGLLSVLAIGLAAYGLLVGRRVIDDRDQQSLVDNDAGLGDVSREKLGACCGFGLPPAEQPNRDLSPATPAGDCHQG